jgi:hypothetical protein
MASAGQRLPLRRSPHTPSAAGLPSAHTLLLRRPADVARRQAPPHQLQSARATPNPLCRQQCRVRAPRRLVLLQHRVGRRHRSVPTRCRWCVCCVCACVRACVRACALGVTPPPFLADVTYGLANFVAAEEFSRFRGFWWSACSSYVLVERADNSNLQQLYISDPSSPQKQPVVHRYPTAGTANPVLSYFIVRVAAEAPARVAVVWDAVGFEYVVTASFSSRGPLLTVMNRSQTKQQVRATALSAPLPRLAPRHAPSTCCRCCSPTPPPAPPQSFMRALTRAGWSGYQACPPSPLMVICSCIATTFRRIPGVSAR